MRLQDAGLVDPGGMRVMPGRRAGVNRLVSLPAFQVVGQRLGRSIASGGILLQAFEAVGLKVAVNISSAGP